MELVREQGWGGAMPVNVAAGLSFARGVGGAFAVQRGSGGEVAGNVCDRAGMRRGFAHDALEQRKRHVREVLQAEEVDVLGQRREELGRRPDLGPRRHPMACPEPGMSNERMLNEVLTKAATYRIAGETLRLLRDGAVIGDFKSVYLE